MRAVRSHLTTVLVVTPKICASVSWLYPLALRHSRRSKSMFLAVISPPKMNRHIDTAAGATSRYFDPQPPPYLKGQKPRVSFLLLYIMALHPKNAPYPKRVPNSIHMSVECNLVTTW